MPQRARGGRRHASAWLPSWISSFSRGNKGRGGTVVTTKKKERKFGAVDGVHRRAHLFHGVSVVAP